MEKKLKKEINTIKNNFFKKNLFKSFFLKKESSSLKLDLRKQQART